MVQGSVLFARNEVGHPMSSFYGYQVIGFIPGVQLIVISSSPTQDGAAPGFFKFQDTDGMTVQLLLKTGHILVIQTRNSPTV